MHRGICSCDCAAASNLLLAVTCNKAGILAKALAQVVSDNNNTLRSAEVDKSKVPSLS